MSPLLILLLGVGLSSASVASRHGFYREDYTYVEEFNAFYKFHCDNDGGNWSSTYQACKEEGAELFYPIENEEWTVVKVLVKALLHPPIVSNIFVGTRDKMNVTSVSTSSRSVEIYGVGRCVTLDTYTGALIASECQMEHGVPRAFVCKKAGDKPRDLCSEVARDVASEVARDVASEVARNVAREIAKEVAKEVAREIAKEVARDEAISVSRDKISSLLCKHGYQYTKETRKCYKLYNSRLSWSEANATCSDGGGSLLILESKVEANIVANIIPMVYTDYFTSVRRYSSDQGYYNTATGQKAIPVDGIVKQAVYGKRDCVTIWTDSLKSIFYDAAECTNSHYFVCEIKL